MRLPFCAILNFSYPKKQISQNSKLLSKTKRLSNTIVITVVVLILFFRRSTLFHESAVSFDSDFSIFLITAFTLFLSSNKSPYANPIKNIETNTTYSPTFQPSL